MPFLGISRLALEKKILPYFKSPSHFPKSNVLYKSLTKNFYLGVLGSSFERLLSYLKSAPSILSYLVYNKESLNLVPKMPHFSIYDLKFENTSVVIEISTLKFV